VLSRKEIAASALIGSIKNPSYNETMSRPKFLPPAEHADEDGVVLVGGRLTTPWLLDAYRHGIFPWPYVDDGVEVLCWFSPDPRGVLELDDLHISRRLGQTIRSGKFEVTFDQDFAGVMHGCATAQDREGNTWITPDLARAYCELHELGIAHSVEVWHAGELAGGTYGVALAGLFAAESMFFRVRDASKVAVAFLVEHLKQRGFSLLDIQQITPHTARLGGIEISRAEFLRRLEVALSLPVRF
jgi:leucyl/phenylalanyl-tRNA--protein transferase